MNDERKSSDEALIDRHLEAGESDLRAFEELVARYQKKVVTNCRYLSRSVDDAQDLAQEVFVKIFFALPRFERRSSFNTWVQRIKANHCMNFLKKQGGKVFVSVDDPDLEGNPETTLSVEPTYSSAVEERQRITEVLDSMSDTLRVPLLLRDMDGFSYQEIADTLGVGLSAVKMRIKRARTEFRELHAGGRAAPPPEGTP